MCQCSVVVAQYNPIWDKVRCTLDSILSQRNCDYEIVIADDGSECTHFDKIKTYFAERNYENYHLVDNKVNGGTVNNIISGIKASAGRYVRVIAPGDMLYEDTTLYKIVGFMDENNAKVMFGKMAYFEETDGEIEIVSKQVPIDFRPYKKKNVNSIKTHLLILGDNISGASYTWDREYYLDCLLGISGKVRYLEDCLNATAIYDNHMIYFLDEFVTWYEHGTGISTSKSNKWFLILAEDWISYLQKLERQYPRDLKIKKAKWYYQMCLRGKFINKVLKNILFFQRYIYSRFMEKNLNETMYKEINKENILKFKGR